jgi:hypothetical protein
MSIEYSSTRNPDMKAKVKHLKCRLMFIENNYKTIKDN